MHGTDVSHARPSPSVSNLLHDVCSRRDIRERKGLFFIEGVRNFVQAVDNRFLFQHILFSDKLLINPLARKLVRHCRRSGVPTEKVSPEAFRQISQTRRASGVAAVVRQRWKSLPDTAPDQGLCWIVLEKVNSPGNLGTLIRSSNAVGGAGFIFIGNSADPYSPDVIRSAMGAVFQQTFIRTDLHALGDWARNNRCAVIGATPEGTADLHSFTYPPGAPLLMLGEERKGLTDRQVQICDHFVSIPMHGDADSLNLGVAGSLMMYEVFRQQRAPV